MMTTGTDIDRVYGLAFQIMEETSLFTELLGKSYEIKLTQAELAGFARIVKRWNQHALDLIEVLGDVERDQENATDTGEAQQ